jgi:isopentenyldiphosphate isomerase
MPRQANRMKPMWDIMLFASERALRSAVSLRRRGAVFLAGLVVGVIGNALADRTVGSPGDLARRLFDINARPITLVNWILLLSLIGLAAAPVLLRAFSKQITPEVGVRDVLEGARPDFLEDEATIAMDGAVTLARCTVLDVGWPLSDRHIDFEHTGDLWTPPVELEDDRVSFRRDLLGEMQRDSTLVTLLNSPKVFSDVPVLRLQTASVRYSDMQFFRHAMLDPASIPALVNAAVNSDRVGFPSGMTAQMIVTTNDHRVVITQRAMKVYWFPGLWTCSIEENMTVEEDIRSGKDVRAVRALVERGLREELRLVEGEDYRLDEARVLSVFLETHESVLATHLCIVVTLELTADECDHRLRSVADGTDEEARRWVFARPEELLPYLVSEDAEFFHPTARYRMLMFLLHKWGTKTLARGLKDCAGRGDDPLGIREPRPTTRNREDPIRDYSTTGSA